MNPSSARPMIVLIVVAALLWLTFREPGGEAPDGISSRGDASSAPSGPSGFDLEAPGAADASLPRKGVASETPQAFDESPTGDWLSVIVSPIAALPEDAEATIEVRRRETTRGRQRVQAAIGREVRVDVSELTGRVSVSVTGPFLIAEQKELDLDGPDRLVVFEPTPGADVLVEVRGVSGPVRRALAFATRTDTRRSIYSLSTVGIIGHTDENGSCRLSGLVPGVSYFIGAEFGEHDKEDPLFTVLDAPLAGDLTHVVIDERAQPLSSVNGRVTFRDAPVAGVQVTMVGIDSRALGVQAKGQTDDQGWYSIDVARPGAYQAVFSPPEESSLGRTKVFVSLRQGATRLDHPFSERGIRGTVRAQGRPVEGMRVGLSATPARRGYPALTRNLATTTDEAGHFAFVGLLPGSYTVRCGGPRQEAVDGSRYAFSSNEVEVPPETETVDVDLRLEPCGSSSGTVLGPDGRPARAILYFRPFGRDSQWASAGVSDGSGRFTLDCVPNERVELYATSLTGALPRRATAEVITADPGAEVVLQLHDATLLRLTGVDSSGEQQPLYAFARAASGYSIPPLPSGMQAQLGFELGPLAPGVYSIVVESLNGESVTREVVIEGGETERQLEVRLP